MSSLLGSKLGRGNALYGQILRRVGECDLSITADGRVYARLPESRWGMTIFDGEEPIAQVNPGHIVEHQQGQRSHLMRAEVSRSPSPHSWASTARLEVCSQLLETVKEFDRWNLDCRQEASQAEPHGDILRCVIALWQMRLYNKWLGHDRKQLGLINICRQVHVEEHNTTIPWTTQHDVNIDLLLGQEPNDLSGEIKQMQLYLRIDAIIIPIAYGEHIMDPLASFARAIEKKIARALDAIKINIDGGRMPEITSAAKTSQKSFTEFVERVRSEISKFEEQNSTKITDATMSPGVWNAIYSNIGEHFANPQTAGLSVGGDRAPLGIVDGVMANSSSHIPKDTIYFTARDGAIIYAHGGQAIRAWGRNRDGPAKMEIRHYNEVFCTDEKLSWDDGHAHGFKMSFNNRRGSSRQKTKTIRHNRSSVARRR